MSDKLDDRPASGSGSECPKNTPSKRRDDWKHRPPYRTTNANEEFAARHTAHCHCGKVKYWLSREKPLAAKFCHCVDCQALHGTEGIAHFSRGQAVRGRADLRKLTNLLFTGAPFQCAAIFHKEDLHFENGADGLAFYHAPTKGTYYELFVKVSCANCHSPIMDEGRNMVLMFPSIINFRSAADKKLFDPQCHIFYSQRVIDLPDGKPKWVGLDKGSELMKDVESHETETVVGDRKIECTE